MENFVMDRLRRKIDDRLVQWSKESDRLPLIVKGARQIGKTEAIKNFAAANYENVIEINFVLQKEYRTIFADGYEVDKILQNITFLNPSLQVEAGTTLIFFDELQACPPCLPTTVSASQWPMLYFILSYILLHLDCKSVVKNELG